MCYENPRAYEVGIYGNGIVLRNEITEELLPAAQQRPRDPMASLAEHGHCVTMIFWQDLVDLLADSLPPGGVRVEREVVV